MRQRRGRTEQPGWKKKIRCRLPRAGQTDREPGRGELAARERGGDVERDGTAVSVTARSSARTVSERVFFSSSSTGGRRNRRLTGWFFFEQPDSVVIDRSVRGLGRRTDFRETLDTLASACSLGDACRGKFRGSVTIATFRTGRWELFLKGCARTLLCGDVI